ncbi:hypothetical protein POSPLADRAFT_1175614 [Postia placenta MAD-698-R-SB12]|uniref:Bis(5'-adenosyl)-triphosphatase n=1 Tax=Postia placenta MAD-698-R-SB12 TaxID=670580 RepID=A0A1X6NE44_9APHY|nr:hypothetical protein POSPLADRAFT_1175614 [Postia placenta MAD-698-R-SB12]OSX66909.1 hypothetical protein POSPLADRAFT_1175614 [Postia placenta MAD-698-R-SB12]
MSTNLFFSTFEVTRQAFFRTSLSYAVVNLKPIVPGHVLVVPTRYVPRITDLTPPELSSLMTAVQQVGRVIERAYGADGLTIACQDGKAAGQTMPHVHFHIIPRRLKGDYFVRNDDVYPVLEQAEGQLPAQFKTVRGHKSGEELPSGEVEPLKMDADDDRKPRTVEEMEKEAQWLKTFFAEDAQSN